MANTKSAQKRVRQTEKRQARNRDRISRIRTFLRKVETAISNGDGSGAKAAFQNAMPEMHRGVSKGVLHKRTVARKLSRLAARIKAL